MRFWSIVGQASIQTARASGPSTMERSRGLPPPFGIQAPRPRARGRDVQPDEAAQRREDTVVGNGPEPQGSRELEIGHCHLAGQHESDRTREEAKEQEGPAHRLEDAGDPELGPRRGGRSVWRHSHGECEELHRAGLNENERGEDAKHTEQPRGPPPPLRDHVGCGHVSVPPFSLMCSKDRATRMKRYGTPQRWGQIDRVAAVPRTARQRVSRRASPSCSVRAANASVGPRPLRSSTSRNRRASVRSVARSLNSNARSRASPRTDAGKSSIAPYWFRSRAAVTAPILGMPG